MSLGLSLLLLLLSFLFQSMSGSVEQYRLMRAGGIHREFIRAAEKDDADAKAKH